MKKPKTTPFSLALRKARPLIESGKEFYICGALQQTGGRTFCRRIMQQLEGHSSYGAWVMCKRRDAWHRRQEIGIDAFKAGRLAWIDDMIRREEACSFGDGMVVAYDTSAKPTPEEDEAWRAISTGQPQNPGARDLAGVSTRDLMTELFRRVG